MTRQTRFGATLEKAVAATGLSRGALAVKVGRPASWGTTLSHLMSEPRVPEWNTIEALVLFFERHDDPAIRAWGPRLRSDHGADAANKGAKVADRIARPRAKAASAPPAALAALWDRMDERQREAVVALASTMLEYTSGSWLGGAVEQFRSAARSFAPPLPVAATGPEHAARPG